MLKLLLESGKTVEFSGSAITIGSKAGCHLVIDNDRRIRDVHVTLRRIGDRWLAESTIPPQVCVDDLGPALWHWIQTPGQVLRLTPNGPNIVYQPTSTANVSAPARAEPQSPAPIDQSAVVQRADEVVVLNESLPSPAIVKPPASSENPNVSPPPPHPVSLVWPIGRTVLTFTWRYLVPKRLNEVAACVAIALFALTLLIAATFRSRDARAAAVVDEPGQQRAERKLPDENGAQNDAKPKAVAEAKPVSNPTSLSDEEKRKQELELKITFTRAMRQWALQRFDSIRPAPSRVDRSRATDVLDKWAQIRSTTLETFVDFPERSRGAVRSGRALNFFLDSLGKTAFEHEMILKGLRERGGGAQLRKELQDLDAKLVAVTAPQDRVDVLRQREAVRAQLVVFELSDPLKVTSDMVRRLVVYEGLGGQKLSLHLQKGALPLQWPGYLQGHAEFHAAMKTLERARDAAIKEVKESQAISAGTHRSMLHAVDELESLFEEQFRPRVQTISAGGAESSQLMLTKRFLHRLRPGVYRFLESQFSDDMDQTTFETGTLPELISLMWSRGLQFGEAAPSSEATQMILFNMMVRYHEQLTSLQLAVTRSEMDIKDIVKQSKLSVPEDFDTLPNVPRGMPLVEDGLSNDGVWQGLKGQFDGIDNLFGK